MGSFYSSCSVSSMTLSHQNVARLFLVPSHLRLNENYKYGSSMIHIFDGDDMREPGYCVAQNSALSSDARNLFKSKGLIVSNEGALGMFVPFSFPIRGEYSDYGDIDYDEDDRQVKAMEAFFNIPFHQICTAASDDRWYSLWYKIYLEKTNEFETLDKRLTQVEKRISTIDNNPPRGYTSEMRMSEPEKEWYIKKMDSLQEEYDNLREELAKLEKDWKKVKKELAKMEKSNDWGFENIPNHPDILAVLTYTDISAEVYDFLAAEPLNDRYRAERIKEHVETYFKYAKERDAEPDFDEAAHSDLEPEMIAALKYMRKHRSGMADYYSLCRNAPYDFFDLMKIGEDYRDEFTALYNFIVQLGNLNKLLLPSISGGQDRNFSLLHKLNSFTNNLLDVEIEKERLQRIEWGEDDDDEEEE